MAESLRAIPKHAMGMHESCPSWCKNNDFDEVETVGRPFSNYLDKPIDEPGSSTFEQTLQYITEPLEHLALKAVELAPNGSTQGNESSHNTITSKCSKRLFHSGSNSANYRCSAGVMQRNLGVTYTTAVRTDLGLSPGMLNINYKRSLARKRQLEIIHKNTPAAKRRRKYLQKLSKFQKKTKETKEGPTYETGLENFCEIHIY